MSWPLLDPAKDHDTLTVLHLADPEAVLISFLQSTYDAAADLAAWDRVKLEREPVAP